MSDVIKSFMVELGWKVDKSGQGDFERSVKNATDLVGKLKVAFEGLLAGAAVYGAYKWLDGFTGKLEDLHYAAIRAGSSVGKLQSFMFAAGQLGSSPEQAQSSAQGFFQWFRNMPNAEQYLRNNLHVSVRDRNGKLISGTDMIKRVGIGLNAMPDYLQKPIGDYLNMPLELRQAIKDPNFRRFEGQLSDEQRRAGLDPEKTAWNAHLFQNQLRDLAQALNIAKMSIVNALVGDKSMGGAMDRFRNMLLSHLPEIDKIFARFTDAGVKGFGKILDYLATVDWDKVFNRIEAFLKYLLPADATNAPGGSNKRLPILSFNEWFWQHTFDDVGGLWDPEARARVRAKMGYHDGAAAGHSGGAPAHSGGAISGKDWNTGYLKVLETIRGLPAGLLDSVGAVESGRGAHLRSGKGAMGPFQFMPATAKLYGLDHPDDFYESAQAAAKLFANLLHKYRGNVDMALAAYNWGEKNLDRFGMGRLPAETRNYIQAVEALRGNPFRGEYRHGSHGAHGARSGAKSSGAPNLHQETHITVYGNSDPHSTASLIEDKQALANQRMARNFRIFVA